MKVRITDNMATFAGCLEIYDQSLSLKLIRALRYILGSVLAVNQNSVILSTDLCLAGCLISVNQYFYTCLLISCRFSMNSSSLYYISNL